MESSWTAIHPSTLCEVLADPLDFLKVEARSNSVQELIAAHAAKRNLEGEQMRPAIGQTVSNRTNGSAKSSTQFDTLSVCSLV